MSFSHFRTMLLGAPALKDMVAEKRIFKTRVFVVLLVVFSIFIGLAARFYYLQVAKHGEFASKSNKNRVRIELIAPNRGLVFDRNGVLLADNQPSFRLDITPEQIKDMDETLEALAKVVNLSTREIEEFQSARKRKRKFNSIPIRYYLSERETARFAVNRHHFPGVELAPYLLRVYPHGEEFAHVLGYVGRLNEADLKRLDKRRYRATTHTGKTGLERYYEDILQGQPGYREIETNAEGRVIQELSRAAPVPGRDITLTIDARLQAVAYAALADYTGSVVAVDPSNGEVLALVSKPGFDPNLFVRGLPHKVYQALLASPTRPLFNRAIQGGYEPGSTIKPFLALGGLSADVIAPEDRVLSTGAFRLPGQERAYRDWKKGGHGKVNLRQAIEESVNIYFYKLALAMGIDMIHDKLALFGFGQPTGIDLGGEKRGVLPSRQWKRAHRNEAWFPGETVIAGIGQGLFVVTPVQLALATTILATRGKANQLHLLKRDASAPDDSAYITLNATSEEWALVVSAMVDVMHGQHGTARASGRGSPFKIAGKSGTSQVVSRHQDDEQEDKERPPHLRSHALFIAFAPAQAPQIAVAVVAEHGRSGSRTAAPIARKLIDAYLGGYP